MQLAQPRLCGVYLSDAYTFLSHARIRQCQEVSAHWDETFYRLEPACGWPLRLAPKLEFSSVGSTTPIEL
jgi:hypothetical protein